MGIWGDIGDVLRGNMSKTGIDRNKQKTSISNIPSHPLIPPSYTAFRVGTNLADAALASRSLVQSFFFPIDLRLPGSARPAAVSSPQELTYCPAATNDAGSRANMTMGPSGGPP